MADEVRDTSEFRRIANLPRRNAEEDVEHLVKELTSLLRTPTGTMELLPVQARALYEIGTYRGGFLPIGVGGGKTLISLLAPYVLDAKRPLLLLPASLLEKTKREKVELSRHWVIPKHIHLLSYEMLGRAQSEGLLDNLKPDLVIGDEVHKLKAKRAAVTRRVSRNMHQRPDTMFVGASGTIMRSSIAEFAPILRWCLKENAPIPKTEHELDDWARVIDAPGKQRPGFELFPMAPGALLQLCTPEELEEDPVTAVRKAFRRRLVETPGVVAAAGKGDGVDCSIYVKGHVYKVQPITEQHFSLLRGKGCRPDGKILERGVDVWRHARELALGFHYEWDPPPPAEWMAARSAWSQYVRGILAHSRTMDSPLVVINAIDAGKIQDRDGVLARWRKVKHTFKPKTVAVWHDDSVLKLCAEWMKSPGIVWTEHSLFARRLSKETGIPYYGAKGLSDDGKLIMDADPTRAAIVSIDANREGKNLQSKWHRNLFTSPADGHDVWEQAIARTHRKGQTADEVIVDVLFGCLEHANAWRAAMSATKAVRDTVGGTPKLLLADIDVPSDTAFANMFGKRWQQLTAPR